VHDGSITTWQHVNAPATVRGQEDNRSDRGSSNKDNNNDGDEDKHIRLQAAALEGGLLQLLDIWSERERERRPSV
jgi:hypothetical protein